MHQFLKDEHEGKVAMKWRGEKLEAGLEASQRERRLCRKAMAAEERRYISEAFKWLYHLGLRPDGLCRGLMEEEEESKSIKNKVVARV